MLREAVTDTLWPEARAESSRKLMRQVLWHIHRAADAAAGERLVLADGAALAAAGVHDVVTLSRADRALVAALPGVSDALAARIIASAAALVRRRGRRVPMGL